MNLLKFNDQALTMIEVNELFVKFDEDRDNLVGKEDFDKYLQLVSKKDFH